MKNVVIILFVSLICLSSAMADIPCWDAEVLIDFAYDGDETLTLFNLPDGSGSAFNEAQLPDGSVADATITMTLIDCYGVPVAMFPAEDMWLESEDSGLIQCVGGAIADQDTDANGVTFWSEPLSAGGSSPENCSILISGNLLSESIALNFNSADINGDGFVNLVDVAMFSGMYFGPYDFSVDFFRDGQLNLADVARIAVGLGAVCP